MTGACHAPVNGRQGKSGGGQNDHYQHRGPIASPVPIEKSADLEMDGRVDLQNLLCLWAAELKQSGLRKGCRSHRILSVWVPHTNRKRRQGIRRCRIPPRRAQCSFDGSAVKSAFALLLAKVTKPAAERRKQVQLILPLLRR